MGRNMEILIEDDKGNQISTHKVSFGSKIYVNEGDKIKSGQKLFEWDPYTCLLYTSPSPRDRG